ncbi:ASCH domain-containing protein [Maricaulis parjimensis]|uniref:ASCH domain-containing protein n=1 Tax=Maricaulis parjimensis TaxID=144023 RepID=UPI001939F4EA|nr:ASCH domain-containing protein [Maricaulis parjimensis]
MTGTISMTDEQAAAWTDFCRDTGHEGPPAFVGPFGDGPELANELLALILIDQKTATCSRAYWYQVEGHKLPEAGDKCLILDGTGRPRCVIETVSARIAPFSSGDADFARAEGEGDLSFDWWRAAHIDYFSREAERDGRTFDLDEDVVFEHFRRIWTAP